MLFTIISTAQPQLVKKAQTSSSLAEERVQHINPGNLDTGVRGDRLQDIEVVGRGRGPWRQGKPILLGLVGLHQMKISGLLLGSVCV